MGAKKQPVIPRFWAKVLKTDFCWLWLGTKTASGYGQFWISPSKKIGAHRFSYELFKGPIQKGLYLDHTCLTPACVRPEHLEAVTPGENVLRGLNPPAQNARKTHCQFGHPLEGENLRISKAGARLCRICGREWKRRKRALSPQVPKTHCKQGHLLDGENIYINGQRRRCRICIRTWNHEWYQRRHELERT